MVAKVRTGLAEITGTGAGASAVLALLVIAAVFVSIVTPRASLSYRDAALRQLISATPSASRTVTGTIDMPTLGGALGPLGQPVFGGMTGINFAPIGAELTRHLVAEGLPIASRAAWWGVSSGYLDAPGAAKSAYFGSSPPLVEILDRSDLARNAKVVAGQLPSHDTVRNTSASFQIAVTTATAQRFSLRVGSVIGLTDRETGSVGSVKLVVSAIVRARHQASSFWTLDPDALRATFNKTKTGGYWVGAAFVADSEIADLETAISDQNLQI